MKKIVISFIAIALLFSFSLPVLATTGTGESDIESLKAMIEQLNDQIKSLQEEIQVLIKEKEEIKEEVKEIGETLRITKQLWIGLKNDDVELLQEFLATDPEIYPEGLITGYFGPLTQNAVKRFQKMTGIEQVGRVGPKTTSKINELLEEGAGNSGKVPPGFLIAPGIKKKLGFEPEPMDGQHLPYGICKKLGYDNCVPGEEEEEECVWAFDKADIESLCAEYCGAWMFQTASQGYETSEECDEAREEFSEEELTISDITTTSTMATSGIITWTTNKLADSKVYYDIITPLVVSTSTPEVGVSDLVLNHDLTLSELTASTTYYFIVYSVDASDDLATSDEFSFTTLSE